MTESTNAPPVLESCPRYLRTKAGVLRSHPAAVDFVLRCQTCRAFLGLSASGYVCPRSLTHTRIIAAAEFERRLAAASGLDEKPAKRLVAFLRRRARWILRLGLDDGAIALKRERVENV